MYVNLDNFLQLLRGVKVNEDKIVHLKMDYKDTFFQLLFCYLVFLMTIFYYKKYNDLEYYDKDIDEHYCHFR